MNYALTEILAVPLYDEIKARIKLVNAQYVKVNVENGTFEFVKAGTSK